MPSVESQKQDTPTQGVDVERDLEHDHSSATESLNTHLTQQQEGKEGHAAEQDDFEVTWDGDNDPANPMNWSNWRKISIIAMVSSVTFLT